jgi:hypothetical protein
MEQYLVLQQQLHQVGVVVFEMIGPYRGIGVMLISGFGTACLANHSKIN